MANLPPLLNFLGCFAKWLDELSLAVMGLDHLFYLPLGMQCSSLIVDLDNGDLFVAMQLTIQVHPEKWTDTFSGRAFHIPLDWEKMLSRRTTLLVVIFLHKGIKNWLEDWSVQTSNSSSCCNFWFRFCMWRGGPELLCRLARISLLLGHDIYYSIGHGNFCAILLRMVKSLKSNTRTYLPQYLVHLYNYVNRCFYMRRRMSYGDWKQNWKQSDWLLALLSLLLILEIEGKI